MSTGTHGTGRAWADGVVTLWAMGVAALWHAASSTVSATTTAVDFTGCPVEQRSRAVKRNASPDGWQPLRAALLERRDVGLVPLDQRDVVQPLEQHLAREGVDLEPVLEALATHDLTFQIDSHVRGRLLADQIDQVPHLRFGQGHGEKAGL